MIRSGSTLQYQLTKSIVEKGGFGKGLGWMDKKDLKEQLKKENNKKYFQVVKCHDYFKEAGELMSNGIIKGIYVYRDVRDILVSLMHKENKPFEETFSIKWLQAVMENDKKWGRTKRLMISNYDEMTSDLLKETKKIATFLNIQINDRLVGEIAKSHSIQKQKNRIEKFNYNQLGVVSGTNIYNPNLLLHKNHIFSGETGQWETELSSLQIGVIENVAHSWLKNKNYILSKPLGARKVAMLWYSLHFIGTYFKKTLLKSLGASSS